MCIRRFRASDKRLLPLVLDQPRLLKNKADPSALALQVGLARPLPPPGAPSPLAQANAPSAETTTPAPNVEAESDAMLDEGVASATDAVLRVAADSAVTSEAAKVAATVTAAASAAVSQDVAAEGAAAEGMAEYERALARGLRLFSLYVAAGGALCMRHAVWRKLMPALHRARHTAAAAATATATATTSTLHGRARVPNDLPETVADASRSRQGRAHQSLPAAERAQAPPRCWRGDRAALRARRLGHRGS